MKIQAGRRSTVSRWNQTMQMWEDPPEPVAVWILRTLEFVRAASYERNPRPLEGVEIIVNNDTYRELAMDVDLSNPLDRLPNPSLFGAAFTIQHQLSVPFEIHWTSREEQALQSLVNRL